MGLGPARAAASCHQDVAEASRRVIARSAPEVPEDQAKC